MSSRLASALTLRKSQLLYSDRLSPAMTLAVNGLDHVCSIFVCSIFHENMMLTKSQLHGENGIPILMKIFWGLLPLWGEGGGGGWRMCQTIGGICDNITSKLYKLLPVHTSCATFNEEKTGLQTFQHFVQYTLLVTDL